MARKKAVSVPPREAKLFRNNKSQALRIPADFELPGDRVMIHRDGDRLIIEPVRRKNLLEVLASLQPLGPDDQFRSEEHTSELQSLMRISYAVFCLKKKNKKNRKTTYENTKNNQ